MVNGEWVNNKSSSLVKFYWNITKNQILISDIPIKEIEELKKIINKETLQKIKCSETNEKIEVEDRVKLLAVEVYYKIKAVKILKNREEILEGSIEFKNLDYLKSKELEEIDIIKIIQEFSKDTFLKIDLKKEKVILIGNFVKELKKDKSYYLELELLEAIKYIKNSKELLEYIKKESTRKKKGLKLEIIKDKKEYFVYVELKREKDSIIGMLHSITDEILENKKIQEIMSFDKVTGFKRKEEIVNIINKKIEKSKEIGAFILINLDNFKFINESFGYEIGDIILKKIGNRLVKTLGCTECVCRYNGDEFIVFLSNVGTKEKVEKILNEIMKIFYKGIVLKDEEIYVNGSIGVSIYPQNGADFYTLLKNSDAALSRAKNNGKGTYVFFDNSILKEFSRAYSIQKYLREAIKREELYVLFQPKVFLEGRIVRGFEALVRWKSRELGIVSPGEMIPIAEVSRQILPISTFVLEEVFKKIRELLDRGFIDFKIAVNLSELQLRYETILPDLKRLKRKYRVNLKYIEIEITESILMKSFEKNIKTLKEVKNMGATIALDDFGTGYSSLNYLTKLPIDVLKIDRSFIMDLEGNFKNKCIVENIINLSHELGMEVVAEGVEERNQVDYLKSIFCDTIQGYYFSKPKPFDEIVEMVGKEIKR